jgi:hypothetical protein
VEVGRFPFMVQENLGVFSHVQQFYDFGRRYSRPERGSCTDHKRSLCDLRIRNPMALLPGLLLLTWHDTFIALGTLLGSLLIYKAITYFLK